MAKLGLERERDGIRREASGRLLALRVARSTGVLVACGVAAVRGARP